MGIDIEVSDIRELLDDEKFMNAVVKKVLKNESAMEEFVEGTAEALEAAIEDDPETRGMFLAAALAEGSFRDRVADALARELIDDDD